jgi:hypothetical protein
MQGKNQKANDGSFPFSAARIYHKAVCGVPWLMAAAGALFAVVAITAAWPGTALIAAAYRLELAARCA